MRDGVDLDTPLGCRGVRCTQIGERGLRDHQIAFGVTDKVLHDPLRFGVLALTEVRPEKVVRREADIGRGRDDDIRDDATFQAPHPVGEHRAGHPTQLLETLGQHAQRGLGPLIGGVTHEPHPRPGQHRAEHMQPAPHPPVDHQRLTRCPHRRATATMMPTPPLRLHLGDQRRKLRAEPA
jgi:hypothetical protein